MLATALWLVSPVIPLWVPDARLGAAAGGAGDLPACPRPPAAACPRLAALLGKGLGVLLLLGGAAMLMGVLGGAAIRCNRSVSCAAAWPPKRMGRPSSASQTVANWMRALLPAATGKPVMLDFYADWCVSCKEMERFTFADPKVAARMKQLLLLQADVTANSDADKALLKRFGLFGPPGIIFFDAKRAAR
jgi:thiol:disulfide interchange protein DsbD